MRFCLILHKVTKRPILPLHHLNGVPDLNGCWRQLSELDQVLFNDVDSLLVLPLLDPTGTELLLLPLLLEKLQLCVSLGGELVLWALYPDSVDHLSLDVDDPLLLCFEPSQQGVVRARIWIAIQLKVSQPVEKKRHLQLPFLHSWVSLLEFSNYLSHSCRISTLTI